MVEENPDIVNSSFWQWAGYALTGLIVLSAVPRKAFPWAVAVLLLGGYYILSKRGGLNGLIKTFSTMGKE